MKRGGCVYILTNKYHTVLYVGVTSDLYKRVTEHRMHLYPESFTSRYNCTKMVYYICFSTIEEAISEEKKIKGGSRKKKIERIESINPNWSDLFDQL